MAKAKKKVPPARVTVHADALTYLRNGFDDLSKEQSRLRCIISETSVREVAQLACHANQIKALEEAICPRVAARLTALERSEKQQIEINDGIGDRLNADDGDKKRVFEVLQRMHNTVLGRVLALEQDVSAINKSIAILVDKQNNAADVAPVVIEDTAENRRWLDLNLARGKGQCSAPSKADDPSKIWKVSREVFFAQDGKSLDKESLSFQKEVYEQMKTIIKIVEQA